MFWEFPGIGLLDPCGIYHFRNAPLGHYFSGYFFLSFYSLLSSLLGATLVYVYIVSVSCFVLLFLSLFFVSCFCLKYTSYVCMYV